MAIQVQFCRGLEPETNRSISMLRWTLALCLICSSGGDTIARDGLDASMVCAASSTCRIVNDPFPWASNLDTLGRRLPTPVSDLNLLRGDLQIGGEVAASSVDTPLQTAWLASPANYSACSVGFDRDVGLRRRFVVRPPANAAEAEGAWLARQWPWSKSGSGASTSTGGTLQLAPILLPEGTTAIPVRINVQGVFIGREPETGYAIALLLAAGDAGLAARTISFQDVLTAVPSSPWVGTAVILDSQPGNVTTSEAALLSCTKTDPRIEGSGGCEAIGRTIVYTRIQLSVLLQLEFAVTADSITFSIGGQVAGQWSTAIPLPAMMYPSLAVGLGSRIASVSPSFNSSITSLESAANDTDSSELALTSVTVSPQCPNPLTSSIEWKWPQFVTFDFNQAVAHSSTPTPSGGLKVVSAIPFTVDLRDDEGMPCTGIDAASDALRALMQSWLEPACAGSHLQLFTCANASNSTACGHLYEGAANSSAMCSAGLWLGDRLFNAPFPIAQPPRGTAPSVALLHNSTVSSINISEAVATLAPADSGPVNASVVAGESFIILLQPSSLAIATINAVLGYTCQSNVSSSIPANSSYSGVLRGEVDPIVRPSITSPTAYSISFTPLLVGRASILVAINGAIFTIGSVAVTPSSAVASMTFVNGCPSERDTVAGASASIAVIGRDAFGNNASLFGRNVTVDVHGPCSANVTAIVSESSTVAFSIFATCAGVYSMSVLLGGVSIACGSSIQLTVAAALPSASTSILTSFVVSSTAGTPTTAVLQLNDRYSNPVVAPYDPIDASGLLYSGYANNVTFGDILLVVAVDAPVGCRSSLSQPLLAVYADPDRTGSLIVRVLSTCTGWHSLNATVNGRKMSSVLSSNATTVVDDCSAAMQLSQPPSPGAWVVCPGQASSTRSTATSLISSSGIFVAGQAQSLIAYTSVRDAWGNAIANASSALVVGSDVWARAAAGIRHDAGSWSSFTNATGRYLAWNTSIAGNHTLAFSLKQPYTSPLGQSSQMQVVQVTAGPADPGRVLVSGDVAGGATNATLSITIRVQDSYGNMRSASLDTVRWALLHESSWVPGLPSLNSSVAATRTPASHSITYTLPVLRSLYRMCIWIGPAGASIISDAASFKEMVGSPLILTSASVPVNLTSLMPPYALSAATLSIPGAALVQLRTSGNSLPFDASMPNPGNIRWMVANRDGSWTPQVISAMSYAFGYIGFGQYLVLYGCNPTPLDGFSCVSGNYSLQLWGTSSSSASRLTSSAFAVSNDTASSVVPSAAWTPPTPIVPGAPVSAALRVASLLGSATAGSDVHLSVTVTDAAGMAVVSTTSVVLTVARNASSNGMCAATSWSVAASPASDGAEFAATIPGSSLQCATTYYFSVNVSGRTMLSDGSIGTRLQVVSSTAVSSSISIASTGSIVPGATFTAAAALVDDYGNLLDAASSDVIGTATASLTTADARVCLCNVSASAANSTYHLLCTPQYPGVATLAFSFIPGLTSIGATVTSSIVATVSRASASVATSTLNLPAGTDTWSTTTAPFALPTTNWTGKSYSLVATSATCWASSSSTIAIITSNSTLNVTLRDAIGTALPSTASMSGASVCLQPLGTDAFSEQQPFNTSLSTRHVPLPLECVPITLLSSNNVVGSFSLPVPAPYAFNSYCLRLVPGPSMSSSDAAATGLLTDQPVAAVSTVVQLGAAAYPPPLIVYLIPDPGLISVAASTPVSSALFVPSLSTISAPAIEAAAITGSESLSVSVTFTDGFSGELLGAAVVVGSDGSGPRGTSGRLLAGIQVGSGNTAFIALQSSMISCDGGCNISGIAAALMAGYGYSVGNGTLYCWFEVAAAPSLGGSYPSSASVTSLALFAVTKAGTALPSNVAAVSGSGSIFFSWSTSNTAGPSSTISMTNLLSTPTLQQVAGLPVLAYPEPSLALSLFDNSTSRYSIGSTLTGMASNSTAHAYVSITPSPGYAASTSTSTTANIDAPVFVVGTWCPTVTSAASSTWSPVDAAYSQYAPGDTEAWSWAAHILGSNVSFLVNPATSGVSLPGCKYPSTIITELAVYSSSTQWGDDTQAPSIRNVTSAKFAAPITANGGEFGYLSSMFGSQSSGSYDFQSNGCLVNDGYNPSAGFTASKQPFAMVQVVDPYGAPVSRSIPASFANTTTDSGIPQLSMVYKSCTGRYRSDTPWSNIDAFQQGVILSTANAAVPSLTPTVTGGNLRRAEWYSYFQFDEGVSASRNSTSCTWSVYGLHYLEGILPAVPYDAFTLKSTAVANTFPQLPVYAGEGLNMGWIDASTTNGNYRTAFSATFESYARAGFDTNSIDSGSTDVNTITPLEAARQSIRVVYTDAWGNPLYDITRPGADTTKGSFLQHMCATISSVALGKSATHPQFLTSNGHTSASDPLAGPTEHLWMNPDSTTGFGSWPAGWYDLDIAMITSRSDISGTYYGWADSMCDPSTEGRLPGSPFRIWLGPVDTVLVTDPYCARWISMGALRAGRQGRMMVTLCKPDGTLASSRVWGADKMWFMISTSTYIVDRAYLAAQPTGIAYQDLNNGSYIITFTPQHVGSPEMCLFALNRAVGCTSPSVGQGIFSPGYSRVTSGRGYVTANLSAGIIRATEDKISITAGDQASLLVSFRDVSNNVPSSYDATYGFGNLSFRLVITGPTPLLGPSDQLPWGPATGAAPCTWADTGYDITRSDFWYQRFVNFSCTAAGIYTFSMYETTVSPAQPVSNASWTLQVLPAVVASKASTMHGPTTAVLGTCNTYYLRLRDAFGNAAVSLTSHLLNMNPRLLVVWVPVDNATALAASLAANLNSTTSILSSSFVAWRPNYFTTNVKWTAHGGADVIRIRACAMGTRFVPGQWYWLRPIIQLQSSGGGSVTRSFDAVSTTAPGTYPSSTPGLTARMEVMMYAGLPSARTSGIDGGGTAGSASTSFSASADLGSAYSVSNVTAAAWTLRLRDRLGYPCSSVSDVLAWNTSAGSMWVRGYAIHIETGITALLAFNSSSGTCAAVMTMTGITAGVLPPGRVELRVSIGAEQLRINGQTPFFTLQPAVFNVTSDAASAYVTGIGSVVSIPPASAGSNVNSTLATLVLRDRYGNVPGGWPYVISKSGLVVRVDDAVHGVAAVLIPADATAANVTCSIAVSLTLPGVIDIKYNASIAGWYRLYVTIHGVPIGSTASNPTDVLISPGPWTPAKTCFSAVLPCDAEGNSCIAQRATGACAVSGMVSLPRVLYPGSSLLVSLSTFDAVGNPTSDAWLDGIVYASVASAAGVSNFTAYCGEANGHDRSCLLPPAAITRLGRNIITWYLVDKPSAASASSSTTKLISFSVLVVPAQLDPASLQLNVTAVGNTSLAVPVQMYADGRRGVSLSTGLTATLAISGYQDVTSGAFSPSSLCDAASSMGIPLSQVSVGGTDAIQLIASAASIGQSNTLTVPLSISSCDVLNNANGTATSTMRWPRPAVLVNITTAAASSTTALALVASNITVLQQPCTTAGIDAYGPGLLSSSSGQPSYIYFNSSRLAPGCQWYVDAASGAIVQAITTSRDSSSYVAVTPVPCIRVAGYGTPLCPGSSIGSGALTVASTSEGISFTTSSTSQLYSALGRGQPSSTSTPYIQVTPVLVVGSNANVVLARPYVNASVFIYPGLVGGAANGVTVRYPNASAASSNGGSSSATSLNWAKPITSYANGTVNATGIYLPEWTNNVISISFEDYYSNSRVEKEPGAVMTAQLLNVDAVSGNATDAGAVPCWYTAGGRYLLFIPPAKFGLYSVRISYTSAALSSSGLQAVNTTVAIYLSPAFRVEPMASSLQASSPAVAASDGSSACVAGSFCTLTFTITEPIMRTPAIADVDLAAVVLRADGTAFADDAFAQPSAAALGPTLTGPFYAADYSVVVNFTSKYAGTLNVTVFGGGVQLSTAVPVSVRGGPPSPSTSTIMIGSGNTMIQGLNNSIVVYLRDAYGNDAVLTVQTTVTAFLTGASAVVNDTAALSTFLDAPHVWFGSIMPSRIGTGQALTVQVSSSSATDLVVSYPIAIDVVPRYYDAWAALASSLTHVSNVSMPAPTRRGQLIARADPGVVPTSVPVASFSASWAPPAPPLAVVDSTSGLHACGIRLVPATAVTSINGSLLTSSASTSSLQSGVQALVMVDVCDYTGVRLLNTTDVNSTVATAAMALARFTTISVSWPDQHQLCNATTLVSAVEPYPLEPSAVLSYASSGRAEVSALFLWRPMLQGTGILAVTPSHPQCANVPNVTLRVAAAGSIGYALLAEPYLASIDASGNTYSFVPRADAGQSLLPGASNVPATYSNGYIVCPAFSPNLCKDGTCRRDESACPSIFCPGSSSLLCPIGVCIDTSGVNATTCASVTHGCPAERPFICAAAADGRRRVCVPSAEHCDRQYGLWSVVNLVLTTNGLANSTVMQLSTVTSASLPPDPACPDGQAACPSVGVIDGKQLVCVDESVWPDACPAVTRCAHDQRLCWDGHCYSRTDNFTGSDPAGIACPPMPLSFPTPVPIPWPPKIGAASNQMAPDVQVAVVASSGFFGGVLAASVVLFCYVAYQALHAPALTMKTKKSTSRQSKDSLDSARNNEDVAQHTDAATQHAHFQMKSADWLSQEAKQEAVAAALASAASMSAASAAPSSTPNSAAATSALDASWRHGPDYHRIGDPVGGTGLAATISFAGAVGDYAINGTQQLQHAGTAASSTAKFDASSSSSDSDGASNGTFAHANPMNQLHATGKAAEDVKRKQHIKTAADIVMRLRNAVDQFGHYPTPCSGESGGAADPHAPVAASVSSTSGVAPPSSSAAAIAFESSSHGIAVNSQPKTFAQLRAEYQRRQQEQEADAKPYVGIDDAAAGTDEGVEHNDAADADAGDNGYTADGSAFPVDASDKVTPIGDSQPPVLAWDAT